LEASIEWPIGVFCSQSPGYHDDMLVLDSTPVETARSRETVKRARDSTVALGADEFSTRRRSILP
jgi:hypothetical protein